MRFNFHTFTAVRLHISPWLDVAIEIYAEIINIWIKVWGYHFSWLKEVKDTTGWAQMQKCYIPYSGFRGVQFSQFSQMIDPRNKLNCTAQNGREYIRPQKLNSWKILVIQHIGGLKPSRSTSSALCLVSLWRITLTIWYPLPNYEK